MPTLELQATDPVRVGPYRLLRRLGTGGMGVVYLAEGGAGGQIAVKCLPPGTGGEVRSRLRREATYLSQVRHRRVAAFVAADTNADRPWIAMDYIAGPSLAQASVPLGPAQLRHLSEGLADALAALHRQGLTHRDVKPGNIILTHDGPVLVDLGIAAGGELTSLTAVGMVVGTPEWMAPEQLSGAGTTPAVDVWGWACVTAYAATGRSPFGTGAIDALAHRIRHDQPDLRGVPDSMRGALLAAFAKDPSARPRSAHLAAVDGIRTVGSRPPQVPPQSPPPPLPLLPVAAPAPRVVPPVSRPPAARPPVSRPPVSRPPVSRPPVSRPPEQRPPRQRPKKKRRSFVGRFLRRLLFTAVLLAAIAVVAVLAYGWVRSRLDNIGFSQALDELRTRLGALFDG